MIEVLIADDQALIRGGMRMILEVHPEIEVVGEAADGHEAVEKVRLRRPDVVLMDVRMPGLDGIGATRRIVAAGAEAPRILILTTFDLDEYVYDAMKAGASGFLLKNAPPELEELTERELEVLRLLARGRSNAEIAAALFISEGTVKTHVSRVLAKLGLRDRVQAVVLAYEAGLVRAGEEDDAGAA